MIEKEKQALLHPLQLNTNRSKHSRSINRFCTKPVSDLFNLRFNTQYHTELIERINYPVWKQFNFILHQIEATRNI